MLIVELIVEVLLLLTLPNLRGFWDKNLDHRRLPIRVGLNRSAVFGRAKAASIPHKARVFH
jgi:hypothetical protein